MKYFYFIAVFGVCHHFEQQLDIWFVADNIGVFMFAFLCFFYMKKKYI